MKLHRTVLVIAAVAAASSVAGTAAARDSVTFNLSWLPQGSTGGVLVAIGQKYYEKAGLEVKAVRGYGGQRTVNEIDQGKFAFGYGDPTSVVLNRAKGGKTRMIGALNTSWPAGLCFIEQSRHPKTLADLKGLRLGGGSGSPVLNVVPAWLELNGLPRDYIRLVSMSPTVIQPSLVEGKIDLAECWAAANLPVVKATAAKAGKTVGWIKYSDYKLDIYGSGLTTTDTIIKEKPDMVRRFIKATYDGYRFMQKQPEKATDIIMGMYPVLNRATLLQQIREMNDLIRDPAVADKGLGWQREDRMDSTVAFVGRAFKAAGKVKASDIYTNQFLK
jgi:NitT/TauT family transport system substrate-binding protein